jgi:O-6-methylguanine DNA methyltransferase
MFVDVASYETPLGPVTLAVSKDGLCGLGFAEYWDRLCGDLERAVGPLSLRKGPVPQDIKRCLDGYFAGDLRALDAIPVDLHGTPFQRKVWAALRTVPPGQTASYQALAAIVGCPGGARAVGAANGANPVCLVVPCHRVIRADGCLSGYGAGVHRKEWLLRHEGVRFQNGVKISVNQPEAPARDASSLARASGWLGDHSSTATAY